MKQLTFRVDAITDAAGKFNPNAVRNGNEDNVFVDVDLSGKANASIAPDAPVRLGSLGMLMVVADGMGGMNAGEVASQIAIDTVRRAFRPGAVPPSASASPEARAAYLEQTIRRADANVKADGEDNPERRGMGSTLIMAWLMPDGTLTLSWIGDSRAYVYNPAIGLHPLSEDHSYVQQLVRNGLITYEQSFDHPQNNVILKSLGDPTNEAEPQTRQFHVGKGDTILLCSDGLSGVLRDRPGTDQFTGQTYKEENIEDIMKVHCGKVTECRQALWSAAERGGWYDNVTIVLCRIDEGPDSHVAADVEKIEKQTAKEIAAAKSANGAASGKSGDHNRNPRTLRLAIILTAIAVIGILAAVFLARNINKEDNARQPQKKERTTPPIISEDSAESIPDAGSTRPDAAGSKAAPASTGSPAPKPPTANQSTKAAATTTTDPEGGSVQGRPKELKADEYQGLSVKKDKTGENLGGDHSAPSSNGAQTNPPTETQKP